MLLNVPNILTSVTRGLTWNCQHKSNYTFKFSNKCIHSSRCLPHEAYYDSCSKRREIRLNYLQEMKKEKGKLQRTKEENNDPEDEESNMQQKRNNAKRNTEEQRGVSRREDREQER